MQMLQLWTMQIFGGKMLHNVKGFLEINGSKWSPLSLPSFPSCFFSPLTHFPLLVLAAMFYSQY